jgi:predicted porin
LENLEMKKTLVALAALATVGAAFAQSTVTLYGKIDWEVVSKRTTTAAGVTTNPGLQVNSAGLSGSRWGLKGSEDLGGGLAAIFDLQGGFAVDSGQLAQCGGLNPVTANACGVGGAAGSSGVASVQSPRIFGRQAFAGLKGGFGQLTVGRQYAPYDNAFGSVDAQGYTSNSAMGVVWAKNSHADAGGGGRVDNQVTYFTPAMGGFSAQLSWAPGEDAAPGVSAGRYYGIGLGYANGPVNIQFATESMKSRSVANAAASALGTPGAVSAAVGTGGVGTVNAWLLGASYDLGMVRPYFAYGRSSNAVSTKDKSWALGLTAPVGPVTVSGGYARETSTVSGAAASARSTGFGGQVVYALSKRTNVYGEMLAGRDRAAGAAASAKYSQYGVGMRHDF